MSRRALITGTSGQDGSILGRLLLERGYEVFGTVRRVSSPTNMWRLASMGIVDRIHLIPGDMTDMGSLIMALRESRADEVYNLAAQSFVKASFEMPSATVQTDAIGSLNLLEAIRLYRPGARVYMACSSEMWGNNEVLRNDETSPFLPASPYALSKVFTYHLARIYREAYGMFVVSGILTNHDSIYRGLEFVSRKITNYVGQMIARKSVGPLRLGIMSAVRDFGYAPDYMDAAWRMLQQDIPKDFVIATGAGHSIEQFAEAAFGHVGEDWRGHVQTHDHAYIRPLDVSRLVGHPMKAHELLDWHHNVSFEELVKMMVDADVQRWQKYLRGESFAWDVVAA